MTGADLDTVLAEARRLHQAGRLAEAEGRYRDALVMAPDSADILSKLGAALAAQGRLEDAARELGRALGIDPGSLDALNNLGAVWQLMGRPAEAVDAFERVLAIDPGQVAAHVNLGNLRRAEGRLADAIGCYRTALAADPEAAAALNGLGAVFLAQGRDADAADAFRRALAIEPDHAEALNNLGSIQRSDGDLEAAVASFRLALEAQPALVEAHINLGNALRSSGDVAGAAESLERALALDPDNAEAHWNHAHVLLLQGRYKEGWAAYEWRARCRAFRHLFPEFPQPRWAGDALGGKTVLVFAEQGFGDAIQFIRYAGAVTSRGGRVVLRCPAPLTRLLATADGVDAVVATPGPPGDFDVQVPLLSLPYVFGTERDTVPDAVPYLHPPAGAEAPLPQPSPEDGRLKVGIAWAGNPDKKTATAYSVDLGYFRPVLETAGCRFYSLHVDPAATADIGRAGFDGRIVDLGRGFGDFADTAAAIDQLDLVISIDTAVTHLAGALGRPVWTLLAHVPDWRWLLDRDDSPWYPTMRLFRQSRPGDWDGVFAAVAAALARRVAGGSR